MTRTRPFTFSELRTMKRCRRKWWLTYFRTLALKRDEPVSAASLGTLVHGALEIIYTPGDERDPIEYVKAKTAADLAEFPEKADKITKQGDLALAMIEGYVEWLAEGGADEDLIILGAEEHVQHETALEDGTPITLLSKMDLRVRRISDQARLFLDHKTVQSFEERVRLLHMDEQMKFYALMDFLTREPDERTDGALYNMLRKVKRTARAKPPFFERAEQKFNVQVLRSFYSQVLGEILEIIHVEAALNMGADPVTIVPPNATKDCAWDCPFLPVCPMFDDSSMVAERVIHSYYIETDPLARYAEKEIAE